MIMKNETAIITGSTSGIGLNIAEKFLEAGCKVTISSSSEEKVKKTLAELSKKYKDSVIGLACDVNDPKALKKLVDKTIEKFGSVRILIANAGTNRTYGPFSNLTADMVSKDAITVIGTNLIGTLNSIAAVMPQMIKQKYGRIITLSGAGAERPMEIMTIYTASKGGIVAFSKSLALELSQREEDIKINIFAPGMIKTNLASNADLVPNWGEDRDFEGNLELVHECLGTDIDDSCDKVIPYALPDLKDNGKVFRGFKIMKMITGGMKYQRILKRTKKSD
ncbi:MAG: SDR family NAD(P)-dependent oxidoreductase [Candidatus Heimdallarchaeota archaeon]|nr:SDR family NAD(P)-dependent oxidoreductase [Candidatus Heimdallarchaeota archaeon]